MGRRRPIKPDSIGEPETPEDIAATDAILIERIRQYRTRVGLPLDRDWNYATCSNPDPWFNREVGPVGSPRKAAFLGEAEL